MRRSLLACSILALAAVAVVQTAAAETRTFNLAGFKAISTSASIKVVLKQGPYSVTADSSEDFDTLKLEVDGDTLVASRKSSGFLNDNARYTITVTAPSIDTLRASSSADITAAGYTFGDLSIHASSSADIKLDGSCKALKVHVSSSADFSGEGLRCETANVHASSSGDADVYATKSAKADASSSADIRVHGKPANVEKDTSSSGSVKLL